MKKFLKLILFLLLMVCLSGSAFAVDVEESQYNALELDKVEGALSSEASDILGDISIMDSLNVEESIGTIITNSADEVSGIVKSGLRSAALIMIIAILCALVNALYESSASSNLPNYVTLAGVLAVSVVAVGDINSFIGLGSSTLNDLETFSKVMLPSMTAAAAAGGAITSAAAKYAATALFLDILLTVSNSILMPLIYAYIAAVIANAAIGGEGIQGAANLLKWVCTTLISALMVIFVAYITISGTISGSADAVTTRAAKTAISTVLPVVGSIISDAASTVIMGASVLRNAVGVFGMLAVIAICLLPFLRLGVHYLMYKLAAGLTGAVADNRMSKLVSGIGSAFGLVMAITGASALMMFFSIISMMKAVSGL